MGEHILKKVLLILCIPILAGCTRLTPYLKVATGNHKFSNGDYQAANIAFIDAGKNGTYEHWISYNLGAVYYALGEVAAAETEWQIATGTQNETLAYKVHFNYGVLLFERGLYAEAYEKFRT